MTVILKTKGTKKLEFLYHIKHSLRQGCLLLPANCQSNSEAL